MRDPQTISAVTAAFSRPRIFAIAAIVQLSVLSVLAGPVAIPAPTEQAIAFHNISNLAWGINQTLTIVLPVLILILGLGTRISNKLLKFGKYATFVIFAAIFFVLNSLIQLPLERIRTITRNQLENDPSLPVLQWIFEQFMSSLPLIVFSILASLFVFWLINRNPRNWWLWAAGVFSFLFLCFLLLEPFTFSHKPLGQSPLEITVSSLAEQIGIPRDSIVLENCEPFDKCEIAHVSGLGPTRLILLNEGLLSTYPESWTVQTVAHEAKHFVKDDNLLGWLVLTIILLAGLWLTDRICRAIIRRYSDQLGFSFLGQAAALPLVILVLNALYIAALPPVNAFRQHVEFEADRYGLELTQENDVLAEMVSSWTSGSRLRMPDPSLFFMLFRSSHPSDAARISIANEYQLKGKHD